MEASLELQQAINESLTVLGFDVYDYRPKKEVYPMILIGDDNQSDLDVKNADYVSVKTTIMVFSNYKGMLEAKQILEQIKNACKTLQLSSYSVAGSTINNSHVVYDQVNEIHQGVIELTFKLIRG